MPRVGRAIEAKEVSSTYLAPGTRFMIRIVKLMMGCRAAEE